MADVQWYYARNDQQFGPVSAAELKQLADSGRLAPDDLLWREGMDAWATAVNLRGLFDEPGASPPSATPSLDRPMAEQVPLARPRPVPQRRGMSLVAVLRAVQLTLWTTCVLVVLVGMVLYIRAFLTARTPSEEAAAAAVFATFFVGAYVLARCGEKLARLVETRVRRRSR
jgi:hypothetical protein